MLEAAGFTLDQCGSEPGGAPMVMLTKVENGANGLQLSIGYVESK